MSRKDEGLSGKGEETFCYASLKQAGVGIGTIGPSDSVPEKGIARNQDSCLFVMETDRTRRMSRTMDDPPSRFQKAIPIFEEDVSLGEIQPNGFEILQRVDGFEESSIGFLSERSQIGGIESMDCYRDVEAEFFKGGSEGRDGRAMVEVPMGQDDEGWYEASRVDGIEYPSMFVARIDDDARSFSRTAVVERQKIAVFADGTYPETLYHGRLRLSFL